MLRTTLCLSAVLATAACVSAPPPVKVPVTGTLGKDVALTGVAQANPYNPLGFYAVQSADQRVRCNGTYNAADTTPRIVVAVSCEDGRFGAVELMRNPDLQSGTGKGTLNDGTPMRVTVGEAPAK